MGAEANRPRPPVSAAGSTAPGPSVHSRRIDRPEASVPVVVVRLRSAVCLLGRFPALAGVDLDVAEGEIVLLSGANGAGKTTLLRLLAGLVPLYSGEAIGARPRPRRRPALGSPRPRARRATRPSATTTSPCARTCGSRPGPSGRDTAERRRRARAARARAAGRRRAPPPLGRAAPTPRGRGRAARVTRACCCSTSPTPGSTPRAARCSTPSCARRRASAAPCSRVARARPRPRARRPRGRVDSGRAAAPEATEERRALAGERRREPGIPARTERASDR